MIWLVGLGIFITVIPAKAGTRVATILGAELFIRKFAFEPACDLFGAEPDDKPACTASGNVLHSAVQPAALIISDAFSAIITVAAWVLPDTTLGITEASTTRSPPTPFTRNCGSRTADGPLPIAQVPV